MMLGFSLSPEILVLGAISGLTYALLAAGLVLVFRASRIINLAYTEIGTAAATASGALVLAYGWNWFPALVVGLLAGGAVAALVELTILRRLFLAPRLIVLIATLGVSQLLLSLQGFIPFPDDYIPSPLPSPLEATVEIGDLILRGEHLMVLLVVPPAIAALAWFLNRSRYGIAIRASSENPDAAELAGISVKQISTIVWILSGVLSALTLLLLLPLSGSLIGGETTVTLGAGTLLRVLCAAVPGRFESLPLTIAGGLGVGLLEAIVLSNADSPGAVDGALFVVLVAMLLLRGGGGGAGSFALPSSVRPLPEAIAALLPVRRARAAVVLTSIAIAAGVPLAVNTNAELFSLTRILIFALIALSVTVLTGWAGQLSLGQFAFVGLGSMTVSALSDRGVRFEVALGYAVVAGVLAAVIVGLPALRTSGLLLTVSTLAFAVGAWSWLLRSDVFLGDDGVAFVPRTSFFGVSLVSQRTYYYLCLIVLVLAAGLVARAGRNGPGRTMVAMRDNEQRAESFGVGSVSTKLLSFAVSGGLAALGGALLAGARVNFSVDDFAPTQSLMIVAIAVIGGLGTITGALLGTLYVIGLPAIFGSAPEVQLLTTGLGLLLLVLYFPGGLARPAFALRDLLVLRWSANEGAATPAPAPSSPVVRLGEERRNLRDDGSEAVPLQVDGVAVDFGGLRAVDDVSLRVGDGEVVGLIGSNGAGKSTLMAVVSGFVTAQHGTVRMFGEDITHLPPHLRAAAGLGRVFQDARLFPSLTVRETILTALETRERSELVPTALALPPARRAERAKLAEAAEVIGFVGLGRYQDTLITQLSTGTRRIVELACLIAQQSRLLLLDEPTAGVAQRETEAFGPLLKEIAGQLGASILLIEHDLPMVLGISDRVYCMSAGRVIAEGLPAEVATDPGVVAAYLGTDDRAIRRSGATAPELLEETT